MKVKSIAKGFKSAFSHKVIDNNHEKNHKKYKEIHEEINLKNTATEYI